MFTRLRRRTPGWTNQGVKLKVGHKTIVGVAVERRRHTAGSARLTVLEGVTYEDDLGPFLFDAIDPDHAAVHTDGFYGYVPLKEAEFATSATSRAATALAPPRSCPGVTRSSRI